MKKLICIISLMLLANTSLAETVILKSGESVEGEITGRTDRYITMDVAGESKTYFLDEIETIVPDRPQPSFNTLVIEYSGFAEMVDDSGVVQWSQKTHRTTYIDAVNNKRRDEEDVVFKMQGFAEPTKRVNINIFKEGKVYTIDSSMKTASYIDLGKGHHFWRDGFVDERFFVEEKELLNRVCRVYKFGDLEVWIWDGVTLKEIVTSDVMRRENIAVSIEQDISIPGSKFVVPEDMTVRSINETFLDVFENVSEMLKVDADAPVGILDLSLAGMGDDEAKQKIMDSILTDETLSEEEKQAAITNIDQMIADQQMLYDRHRSENGAVDMGGVISEAREKREEALRTVAVATINSSIPGALKLYELDNGMLPTTEQGLSALAVEPSISPTPYNWEGPYISESSLIDPWGNKYGYKFDDGVYEIWSLGPDGVKGDKELHNIVDTMGVISR